MSYNGKATVIYTLKGESLKKLYSSPNSDFNLTDYLNKGYEIVQVIQTANSIGGATPHEGSICINYILNK